MGESIAFSGCMCTGVEYNLLNFNEANHLSLSERWDQTAQSTEGLHAMYKVKVNAFDMKSPNMKLISFRSEISYFTTEQEGEVNENPLSLKMLRNTSL